MNSSIKKRAISRWSVCFLVIATMVACAAPVFAQDSAEQTAGPVEVVENSTALPGSTDTAVIILWCISIAGAISALFFAWKFFTWMVAQDEGDEKMIYIAENVREGARAYLNRQYKVVAVFFVATSILLTVFAYVFEAQSKWVPFAFITGGLFSGLAGWFGMKTATLASARTAHGAKTSLNDGLQVAFRSGAVMGLVVVGLGLLDICLWFAVLNWVLPMTGAEPMDLPEITVTMLCFGMGASCQALFARVGGGIFTKAADVGADLVGKVEAGIPEDDPRNPATIADNVGDNVGDVAGMGADLYESYCGSILASAALGVAAYRGYHEMQYMMLLLPMVLAGVGIAVSIGGIHLVKAKEGATQRNLLAALARGIDGSAILVAVLALALVYFVLVIPSNSVEGLAESGLPHGNALLGVFFAILTGLVSGWIIGKWTEYSTSEEYAPTRRIADQAATGPATVIIAGIAEGFYSVSVPILVIGAAIIVAFGSCTGFDFANPQIFAMGLYGVAIAAVGMLSTLGITLATDAYGPIADNAGGNAEMSGQDPKVRERTDALDSLGNTTAATGKGFAIGSAALTALALMAAYLEEVRVGFDRWADKETIAVSTDLGNAEVVKLSPSALAVNPSEESPNKVYLMFPAGNTKDETLLKIKESEIGKTLTGIDLLALVDENKAVPNSIATMPDYSRYYDFSLMNPKVLVGMFIGVMLAFVFCAMTMKAVGRAAGAMVEEVRRQFREIKGIMEGEAEPEYASCVAISTAAAQKEMVAPAFLAIAAPVAVGFLLGVGGVMGMLAGGLTGGFAVAIMMANAGGSWDNAKKYIESGKHGGKGTDAHKATVVGDTVGDPFKDTSGPSLNILIKLMSMVSVVFAGLIVQYALNF
jgi:inorganic pyrophosphatase/K(+)-stimulated pyrophosphate-energized sodium pump